jgi:hypothetical protein
LIQDYPVAIQLRFLQTVVEITAENNSTTVFPIPMDLFKPIVEAGERFKTLGGASPGDLSKTLGAASSGNALPASLDIPIPSGVDPAMLTEAAKAPLGIGAGGSSSGEQVVPSVQGVEEGEDE